MSEATAKAYIDKAHPKQDGTFQVYIRVIANRKHKSYKTGICLSKNDFERSMNAKRRTDNEKEFYRKIQAFETKANKIIKDLYVFTFSKFEDLYLSNRDAPNSIAFAFDKFAQELREQDRIGTAVSYETARNSLEAFKKNLKFADITPSLLNKYESWMLKNGRSRTTVGIYLRALRTIFNKANIDRSLYPFGTGKGKYSIPTSRNINKALNLSEVHKLFMYQAESKKYERAKDYWIFLYLCNGMNVKDFCLLKSKNIDGDVLRYQRAKTKRSKKESTDIIVSLKPQAKEIIKKYGRINLSPDAFLFPHLDPLMNAETQRDIIQLTTKTINKCMKRIGKEIGIIKPLTTYSARHSFATILKNAGQPTEFISEALGHSSLPTTKSYLAGFETEQIHKATDVLTAFESA